MNQKINHMKKYNPNVGCLVFRLTYHSRNVPQSDKSVKLSVFLHETDKMALTLLPVLKLTSELNQLVFDTVSIKHLYKLHKDGIYQPDVQSCLVLLRLFSLTLSRGFFICQHHFYWCHLM